jgi:thiamine biosynthesis lipoprotein
MATTATHDWEQWSSAARLIVTRASRLDEAIAVARDLLDEVDRAASRFRPDSELMTLGRDDDGGVEVSDVLAALVREALEAAAASGGAVDPTVGSALLGIGYDRDIDEVLVGDGPVRVVVQRVPGWRSLRLEGTRLFRPVGACLDLGATAKAVAADWVAAAVAERCDTGVLVSLGGDIATAGTPPPDGWQIAVRDVESDPAARISLGVGAVATSSTVRRAWTRAGVRDHHVVDPRTSLSVGTTWRSVSVVADTCAQANTVSTAALVKGPHAPGYVRATGRPARFVREDRRVLLLNGWPEERSA